MIEILCGRGGQRGGRRGGAVAEGKGEGRMGGGGRGWKVDDLLILYSHVISNIPLVFLLCHDRARGCELKCMPIYLIPVIGHQRDKVCTVHWRSLKFGFSCCKNTVHSVYSKGEMQKRRRSVGRSLFKMLKDSFFQLTCGLFFVGTV
jgi:hypothetical protein